VNVEIKKNLIIFHNPWEWESISERLIEEYGISIMISWKCKRKLGFTVRHHKGLVPFETGVAEFDHNKDLKNRYYYEPQIHLDFYNEAQQSFFMLKYISQ
jgi:hypothetical protein